MSRFDGKLHQLLMDRADEASTALAYGPVRYGVLTTRAARVAGTLREAGVRRDDRVAVALDGCVEYLVAYYGTLMAGATVVPLSPELRGAGLSRVLDHCGATAVIAAGPTLDRLAASPLAADRSRWPTTAAPLTAPDRPAAPL